MRTFIALELSPEIKQALGHMVDRLSAMTGNVRWVKSEGMHLTLKFLGEISDAQAQRLDVLLKDVAARHGCLRVMVKGAGWFPERSRSPRVLWAGIEAGPELAAFHRDLDQQLQKEGFPPEDRPFHPHLTLGRVKSPSGLQPVLQELERSSAFEFGVMTAARVTFFQSRLKPGGAEYSVLGAYALK